MADDLVLELARFIERVGAIARTGLAFKPDGFDAERYEDLLREAARLRSLLDGRDASDPLPLYEQWRQSVGNGYDAYATTAVGSGAIAFNQPSEDLILQHPNRAS